LTTARNNHLPYDPLLAAIARYTLRDKTEIVVDPRYTAAYEHEHANPNAVQVFFRDSSKTARVEFMVPLGDPQRRKEGLPALLAKFQRSLALRFAVKRQHENSAVLAEQHTLKAMPVGDFMALLAC
jgi:2-methylcitrate dehydratase